MAQAAQREWLHAFIDLYKSEPCLWKIKSKEYHDRNKKDAAYEKLILKLRELEPTANRETVIRKINSIRCTYKKEYKKVMASMNGSNVDNIYEPKLWYYSLMSFLDTQDMSRSSISEVDTSCEISSLKLSEGSLEKGTETTVSEDNWNLGVLTIKSRQSTDTPPITTMSNDSVQQWSPKLNLESPVPPQDILLSVQQVHHPTPLDDRFDVVGKLVSLKLRGLSKEQALLAEKLINETLFEAELGNLTTSHGIQAQNKSAIASQNVCARCDGSLDIPVPVLEFQTTYNSPWDVHDIISKQNYGQIHNRNESYAD